MTSTLAKAAPSQEERDPEKRFQWRYSYQFVIIQVIALAGGIWAVWSGRWNLLEWGFLRWFIGMFFLTAGYHRYFAHRSYELKNRRWQFVFGFLGTMAAQKGPIWWAGHHRVHHHHSDDPEDIHSPRDGFWWSHIGWISSPLYRQTRWDLMPEYDLPEMHWLEEHDWVGPWVLGTVCFLGVGLAHAGAGFGAFILNGLIGLWVVFFASTLVLWHGTFVVNSLTHVYGRRAYKTTDDSLNSWLIALFTGGEGWHNNHHRFQKSARQGFEWWQLDTSYYILRFLRRLGITHSFVPIPQNIIDLGRRNRQLRREGKSFEEGSSELAA